MIQRCIDIHRVLMAVAYCCHDLALPLEEEAHTVTHNHLERNIRELERMWPDGLDKRPLLDLKNKVKRHDEGASIMDKMIPNIEDAIDSYFSSQPTGDITIGIVDFLHPTIITSSYAQFRNGQYRDAVLNAIMAVFELVRRKIKSDKDGSELVCEALSLSKPKIIISNLDTESGRNEQKGYLQILQGAFWGIRNPKAHSLSTDLDKPKAAQYLVFASLLARRIDEAIVVDS